MTGKCSNQLNPRMKELIARVIPEAVEEDLVIPPSSDPETGDSEGSEGRSQDEGDDDNGSGVKGSEDEGSSDEGSEDERSEDEESKDVGEVDAKSEDSQDQHVYSTDYKENLLECLETIGDGSFAITGTLPNTNPGLCVEGLGKVGLPLSERDGEAWSSMYHSVRSANDGGESLALSKNLNINRDHVDFRNPQWNAAVRHAMSEVLEGLGFLGGRAEVRTKLSRVLLSNLGLASGPNCELEKTPGLIATMAIILPSEHAGGEVDLSLGKLEKSFRTDTAGDFETRYLAWYADVDYITKAVTSGYRLVLIYHIFGDGSALHTRRPETIRSNPAEGLNNAIEDWLSALRLSAGESDQLIYMTEHDYSRRGVTIDLERNHSISTFNMDSIKGKDQLRARYLIDAARAHDVCIYLADFEHTESGTCEPYDDEDDEDDSGEIHNITGEVESAWNLLNVYTTDGTKLAQGIEIDEDDFLQDASFSHEEPDEEEFHWSRTTHFYRRSCIVLVPRKQRRELFSSAEHVALNTWAGIVVSELDQGSNQDMGFVTEELDRISSLASKPQAVSRSKEDPQPFVNLALRCQAPKILKSVSGEGFELGMFRTLGEAALDLGDQDWREAIQHALSHTFPGRKRLEAIDVLFTTLRNSNVNEDLCIDESDHLRLLIKALPQVWRYRKDETVDDAKALVALHKRFGETYIKETLCSLARGSSNLTFIDCIAHTLFDEVETSHLNLQTVRSVCDDLFQAFVSTMTKSCPWTNDDWQKAESLREGDLGEKLTWQDSLYDCSWDGSAIYPNTRYMLAEKIVRLIDFCEKMKLSSAVHHLLNFLINLGGKPNEVAFLKILLPSLRLLPPPDIEAHDDRYQQLFQSIVSSYIHHFVKDEPKKPQDWSRQKAGCGGKPRMFSSISDCRDCAELDAFLVDPNRSTMYLKGAEPRRKHLSRQLPHGEHNTSTDKSKGTPHTLVIHKTDAAYQRSLHEWQLMKRKVASEIYSLGRYKIVNMLGDLYPKVLALMGQVASQGYKDDDDDMPTRRPLADVTSTARNTQANKRACDDTRLEDTRPLKHQRTGVEIIDLECVD